VHMLQMPEPHVLGHLEFLWRVGYSSGNPVIGDEVDVEIAAKWAGERGRLCTALADVKLIDVLEDGKYQIHDLHENAPSYVKSRARMEKMRKKERREFGASVDRRVPRPVAKAFLVATKGKRLCVDCGRKRNLEIDHIVPVDKGGSDELANLQWLCMFCNRSKHNKLRDSNGGGVVTQEFASVIARYASPAPTPAPAPAPALKNPPSEGSSAPLFSDASPALLTFPAVGNGPKTWILTEGQCSEWRIAYPGLDVLGECRKALAWVDANGPKTAKGMKAFLVSWFNRAVQRGGNHRPLGLAVGASSAPVRQSLSPAVAARLRQRGVQ
jgi:5-methylcytosine-specific restriction protein A